MTFVEWFFVLAVLSLAIVLIGDQKPRWLAVLAVLAVVVVYSRGDGFKLRSWNVFHYYLGSKYYHELGYDQLYPCALQVARERADVQFGAYARDLATYRYRPAGSLRCTATFTPARWHEFSSDMAWILARPGRYPEMHEIILLDKGYNMLPTWTGLVEPLTNRAPVGSVAFWLLIWSELALLAGGIFLLWRARGLEAAAVAVLFMSTYWGTYGIMAGNLLQYIWLGAMLAGLACWHMDRRGAAGALLATAAALRIFPAFLFIWPLLYPRLAGRRFWGGAAAAGASWVVVGSLTSRGLAAWPAFVDKMAAHSAHIVIEPLNIGLRNLLAMLLNPGMAERHLQFNRTGAGLVAPVYEQPFWIGLVVMALAVLALWQLVRSRRPRLDGGLALMFVAVVLSRYYYQALVAAVFDEEPAKRRGLLLLALILAAGAASWPLYGYLVFQIALAAFLARFYGLSGEPWALTLESSSTSTGG